MIEVGHSWPIEHQNQGCKIGDESEERRVKLTREEREGESDSCSGGGRHGRGNARRAGRKGAGTAGVGAYCEDGKRHCRRGSIADQTQATRKCDGRVHTGAVYTWSAYVRASSATNPAHTLHFACAYKYYNKYYIHCYKLGPTNLEDSSHSIGPNWRSLDWVHNRALM